MKCRLFYFFFIFVCVITVGCGEMDTVLTSLMEEEATGGMITDIPQELQDILQNKYNNRTEHYTALLSDPDGFDAGGNPIDIEWLQRELLEAEALLTFYTKHIDAGGVAIVGNDSVKDEQLYAAQQVVLLMTSKRPELREQLTLKDGFRFIIYDTWANDIGDIPELTYEPGSLGFCTVGYCVAPMSWKNPYYPERAINMHISTLIHEFGHAIHKVIEDIDPTFNDRLKEAYQLSLEDEDDFYWENTYSMSNYREYWAEGTVVWFYDTPSIHPWVLRRYEPNLWALLSEWYPKIYLRPLESFDDPVEWFELPHWDDVPPPGEG